MQKQNTIFQYFKKKKPNANENFEDKCTACGLLYSKEKSEKHSCPPNSRSKNKDSKLSHSSTKINASNSTRKIEVHEISDSEDGSEIECPSGSPVLLNMDSMDSFKEGYKNKEFYSSLCEDWSTPESSPSKSCPQSPSLITPLHSELKDTTCLMNGSKLTTSSHIFNSSNPPLNRTKSSTCTKKKNSKLVKKMSISADDLTNINGKTESDDDFEYSSRINFLSPSMKRRKNTFGSCSSKSSNTSYQFSPKLVTPERTPTPSPDHMNSQCDLTMSQGVSYSPEKYGIKKKLESVSKNMMPSFSQSAGSQKKKTPRSTFKAISNSSPFRNSSIPSKVLGSSPNGVRNLTEAFGDVSENTHPLESTKKLMKATQAAQYRGINGMYLDNFFLILNIVLSQPMDAKLLNSEDLEVVEDFKNLSLEAQKLYIRLFQRKLKWNRAGKIEYNDICDKEDISLYINELIYANFLFSEKDISSSEDALSLLSAPELKTLCKDLKVPTTGKKEDLVKSLLQQQRQQKTILSAFKKTTNNNGFLLNKVKKICGRCCLIDKSKRDVFKRIFTLFSLPHYDEDLDSGQQSQLSVLLMVALGKVKFPEVSVVRTLTPFQTRDELIRFDEFHQLENEVRELSDNKKWKEIIDKCEKARDSLKQIQADPKIIKYDLELPTFLRKYTCISLLLHIMCYAVEAYQHIKEYRDAIALLQELLDQETHHLDYRGRWYDRLALNWDQHLKNPKKALQVIKKGMNDSNVRVGHRLSLSQRASRILSSKRGAALVPEFEGQFDLMKFTEAPTVTIQGRSLPSDISGYKRVYISSQDDFNSNQEREFICSVEELCISHYKKEGYPEGLHSEGKMIAALFGSLFWDVIYAEVPDVFRTKHQGAPLDLDSDEFYKNRKSLFDKRFEQLKSQNVEEIKEGIQRIWTQNHGTICIFDWNLFRDVDHLQGLVESLGIELVSSICWRLATNHRFTRSGFPDLVVWNPIRKKSRIVEVKGPNDKLSTKQMLWLDFLLTNGAVAEVCHVEALGSKKIGNGRGQRSDVGQSERRKVKSPSKNISSEKRNRSASPTKEELENNSDEDFFQEEPKSIPNSKPKPKNNRKKRTLPSKAKKQKLK